MWTRKIKTRYNFPSWRRVYLNCPARPRVRKSCTKTSFGNYSLYVRFSRPRTFFHLFLRRKSAPVSRRWDVNGLFLFQIIPNLLPIPPDTPPVTFPSAADDFRARNFSAPSAVPWDIRYHRPCVTWRDWHVFGESLLLNFILWNIRRRRTFNRYYFTISYHLSYDDCVCVCVMSVGHCFVLLGR